MKTHFAALCVALIAVFALSACGGSNDTNSTKSDKESDKPKTAADHRQDVVDKMKTASEALDWDAMKVLFHADEQATAEKRIGGEFKELKEKKGTVKVNSAKLEEKEGKFFVTVQQTIEVQGEKDEDDHTLSMIEKDGKWYLSFTK